MIPASTLAHQAATHGHAKGSGARSRLEALAARDSSLEPRSIAEEFTRLMQSLAVRQPLLIVMDDLQWVDSASLNFLFHLGRNLVRNRILLLGAYRPSDIVPETGEREPHLRLPGVVNELRRRFGNIVLDLDRFNPSEDRGFVDVLLDQEPNDLDEDFRVKLFWRTRGHPLFTVELLQALKNNGDLLQGPSGVWQSREIIHWDTMPARMEAVIAQRIKRLPANLRDLLATASVEGESFTVQILAHVQELSERTVLRYLADLQTQHALVQEQAELAHSGTRYQFSHILFQQYCYESLSQAQRRHRHGLVAAWLRERHQPDLEPVAARLAYHYVEADDLDRAVPFHHGWRSGTDVVCSSRSSQPLSPSAGNHGNSEQPRGNGAHLDEVGSSLSNSV